jgi:DNA-binding MarR family transcriptional regulator
MEHVSASQAAIDVVSAARVWRLTFQFSAEVLNEAAAEIEALGLEPKEFFVLDGIEERPYPAELARYLSMPKPTVTLYLKSLQAKAFIARGIDPHDLRRHRLELTAAGFETITKARDVLAARYSLRLDRLSTGEQDQFTRLLEKLAG